MVSEICGEHPSHNVVCAFFEFGGNVPGNNFVGSGSMVLCKIVVRQLGVCSTVLSINGCDCFFANLYIQVTKGHWLCFVALSISLVYLLL